MREVPSLAIIITDPRHTISTWRKRFSAPLGVVGGTSVLRRVGWFRFSPRLDRRFFGP